MTTAQELYAAILPHALGSFVAKTPDMDSAKQMADSLTWEVVGECGRLGLLENVAASPRQQFQDIPAPLNVDTGIAVHSQASAQGLASFPDAPAQGASAGGVNPVGAPYQPAQHYNVRSVAGAPAVNPGAPPVPVATPWYPPHLAHLHQQQPVIPQHIQQQLQMQQQQPGFQVPQAQVASGAGTVATQAPMYDVAGMRVIPPSGNTYQPPAQAGVMTQVTQIPTPQGHSALGTDGVITQPSQRPNTQDTVINPSSQLVVQQVGGAGTQYVAERITR